jgi:16S rRNA (cytidine1402-2'-O)-methyltransferase
MAILYIVATPIGNLKDITYRAVEVLSSVDVIACEDTRHTLKLLNHYNIKKSLFSCRSQNEAKAALKIVELLEEGKDVAYASDAGTPGLSDPGTRLVDTVREHGYAVVPIPGVSAFTTLMSVAGIGGKTVTFEGFISTKPGKRKKRLQELLSREEGFIIFESPHRIVKVLQEIADCNSKQYVCVGREMTKRYEEYIAGTILEVLEYFGEKQSIKGEFSVYISGKKKS